MDGYRQGSRNFYGSLEGILHRLKIQVKGFQGHEDSQWSPTLSKLQWETLVDYLEYEID